MNEPTRKLSRVERLLNALDSQHHRRASAFLTVLLDFLYTSIHALVHTVFQIYIIIQCSGTVIDSVKGKRHRIDYW